VGPALRRGDGQRAPAGPDLDARTGSGRRPLRRRRGTPRHGAALRLLTPAFRGPLESRAPTSPGEETFMAAADTAKTRTVGDIMSTPVVAASPDDKVA